MMTISKSDFAMAEVCDDQPDASYLEQDGFEERKAEYDRGEFHFIGIRASVTFDIPSKQGGYWTTQTIESPGLWCIESDSDRAYLREVFSEECDALAEMLEQLGVNVTP